MSEVEAAAQPPPSPKRSGRAGLAQTAAKYSELKPRSFKIPRSAFLPGIWLILFLLAPLIVVALYSLAMRGAYGGVAWHLTTDNYIRAMDPLYLRIIWKSLSFAFSTTLSCLVIGYPVAYVMVRSSKVVRSLLLFLIVIPFITNFVVRAYALKGLLGMQGPVNMLLIKFGWITEPISFLNRDGAILFGMVANYLPFMVLPLFVAVEKFDFTWLEASCDLGATAAQSFFRVLLPLTARGIWTGCFLVFIPALGEFVIPEIFGGGRAMFIGNLITDQFLKARDWPFGSALSMILFAFLGLGFIGQRYLHDYANDLAHDKARKDAEGSAT